MEYSIISAPVHLHSGCALRYTPGEVRSAVKARFVRCAETLEGPLNHSGRRLGRYTDHHRLVIRLEDGSERTVSASSVQLDDTGSAPIKASIHNGFSVRDERLGDLPYPIELWPGDRIRDTGRNQEWFEVESISFDENGKPVYTLWNENRTVQLTRHYGPDGGMCRRGNVYYLYNDPEKLSFDSPWRELTFWTRKEISVHVPAGYGMNKKEDAVRLFDEVFADAIFGPVDLMDFSYYVYKLHPIFAEHQLRVRALTEQVFKKEFEEARAAK